MLGYISRRKTSCYRDTYLHFYKLFPNCSLKGLKQCPPSRTKVPISYRNSALSNYLIFDKSIGVKWYLFDGLRISLTINEVGHLFMCV